MYCLAERYQVPSIKDACRRRMLTSLDTSNAIDAAIVATTYGDEELERVALDKLRGRVREVKDNKKWKELERNHPELLTKLLVTYDQKNMDKSHSH